jgi:RND family efflux transporter MFP subunit
MLQRRKRDASMKRMNVLAAAGLCLLTTVTVSADVVVTVAPVSELQEQMTAEFPASAEPIETSLLSSGISAEIVSIDARPGDRIARGTTLVQLDCRDTTLRRDLALQDLKQAEVQFKFSERQASRVAKLAETNIASEELKDTRATELQQSRIGVEAKRVALREAELQVSKCEVKAPFDSVIVEQLASVGTRVSVGSPILKIVSVVVDIRARVPFDYVVDTRQNVVFESGRQSVSARLLVESEAVDTGTGTRLLRFTPETPVAPGSPGVLSMRSESAVLPADFLVERDRQYGVMAAIGTEARFIERPTAVLGQPVVVSDLEPTLLLIKEGRFRARHGDTLVIRQ